MASIGGTLEEIGAVVGVSKRTLIRREQEWPFRAAIGRGRACGRVMLRWMQMTVALAGNITMLIWLGKLMMGQQSFEHEAEKHADTTALPRRQREGADLARPGAIPRRAAACPITRE